MRHITHKYTDPGNACVAVSCRVLQCVAVCCSVLQCVAVRCSALQCVAVRCSVTNSQILAMYREHSARNRANFCSGNSKRDPLLYWKRPIYWISECFGNSCDSHMRLTCAVTATHTSLSLPHNATHCNTPNQTYEKNASLSLFSWYVRFIREFRICVTYEVQCWWCKKRVFSCSFPHLLESTWVWLIQPVPEKMRLDMVIGMQTEILDGHPRSLFERLIWQGTWTLTIQSMCWN